MTIKNLKVGSKDISKMYVGERMSDTVYLGNEKVYENPLGAILEYENESTLVLQSNEGDFKHGVDDYNYPIISKIENGVIDLNGCTYGLFAYDETPIGELIIDDNFKILQCDKLTVIDGSDYNGTGGMGCLVITGDRGSIKDLTINNATVVIKPTHGGTITNLNINRGRVYIIADNLNIDINQDGGILYLVTHNSTGTLNLSGGERYLSGNNNLNLNLYGGITYVNDTDLNNFITNFVGSGTVDIQGGLTDDFIWE